MTVTEIELLTAGGNCNGMLSPFELACCKTSRRGMKIINGFCGTVTKRFILSSSLQSLSGKG